MLKLEPKLKLKLQLKLRLKANVEVKAALEKEHETSLLREQFIAVLGHDLRNPFASLSAGLRLLAKNVESNDRNEKIIGEKRRKQMGARLP